MVFSKQAIIKAIKQGKIVLSPYNEDQIEAAHINLHLDILEDQPELTVAPKSFILARTQEKITLAQNLCGFMEGKASLARKGISVEQSSTFVEPGTNAQMTLEIFNASTEPVVLKSGQSIAKLFVLKVTDEV